MGLCMTDTWHLPSPTILDMEKPHSCLKAQQYCHCQIRTGHYLFSILPLPLALSHTPLTPTHSPPSYT